MEKGKEPVIYISDDEKTTEHSEEKLELNNGEMMNAPEEKAKSDAVKLAELKEAKRRQQCRASAHRWRENEKMYITNMEKEAERLKNDNSNNTKRIKLFEHTRERLHFENLMWSTRLQSLKEGYIQSLEEYRRLQQERIDLENLQQEQSRASNAAQDPNSMLEPWQIQTSGPSHQHAHQPGGHGNAAYHSSGIMLPQQIHTSGQADQPGGPHNAAYHSSGIMVPQQIQTSGPLHQHVHQLGGPHNNAYHSSGIMVPQQIQTSGSSHPPGEAHNAAHHSYGMLDINDIINGVQEPGMRELGQSSASQNITTDEWVELCINDFDQNVPAPQLSADDSILGWEMLSTAQLQEGMCSTDVEKAKSDAGQIE